MECFTVCAVNECSEMLHNCHADGMCVDTIGMFNCTCLPGYSGNGTFCENGKKTFVNTDIDLYFLFFKQFETLKHLYIVRE